VSNPRREPTPGSVWEFLSYFKRGVGRSNRYRVEFVLPRGIPADTVGANGEAKEGTIQQMHSRFNSGRGGVNIKCHTATFPQRSMLTVGLNQNSAEFRVPYSATYDPVTFSFYADSEMDTRDYFEIWQSSVCNFSNNTMNFLDEYTSDVKIIAMDQAGRDTYGVTLFEAWPLNIGTIDMSYSAQDAYQTTIVTMSYKSWLPQWNTGGTNRSAPPPAPSGAGNGNGPTGGGGW